MNSLGERLYELRTKNEMSQGDLAEKLDVSRQTISKWENNMSIPELDKIISLSDLFGVSVDYIVKGEGVAVSAAPPQFSENAYENVKDPEPVRMIRVEPTKRIIAGISIGLGVIYLITLLVNSGGLISNIIHGHMTSQTPLILETCVSMAISFFACGCLLACKLNLLSIAYILHATCSVISMISAGSFGAVGVLKIAAYLLIAVLYFKGNKKNSQIIFALIAVFFFVGFIWQGINLMNHFIEYNGMTIRNAVMSILSTMINNVPYLIVNIGSASLMYLRANPKPTYEVADNAYPAYNDMYVGIVKHILLSLFTLGIYDCIWTYKTTEVLSCGNNEKQSGAKKLLLCILVPFYRIYWYYAQSRRLENLIKDKDGNASDFAAVTLVLAIFVPIVAASAFLQIKINEYAKNRVD